MILVVAPADDPHARLVTRHIEAAGGIAHIVDFAQLAERATFCYMLEKGCREGSLSMGEFTDVAGIRTIWLRRPAVVRVPGAVKDGVGGRLIRQEWSAAMNGMVLSYEGVRWVNNPFAQNAASKPIQLHHAQESGLAIPDTLITNDPGRARDFVKRHDGDVIHKTLTDPSSHLLDTRMWDASTDDGYLDDSLPLAPVIFQSRIRGADVRSVLIGSEIFSVIIDSEGSRSVIDSRLDLDATYRPYEVAAPAVAQLHDLMARLGLVFGVADFKIDHDGNLVFLEINPQGQFLFMEILTHLPISDALARFLMTDGLAT